MPDDTITPDGSIVRVPLSTENLFKPIDTIASNTDPDDLLQKIQDRQREGLPLVITGINTDPYWPCQQLLEEDFNEKSDTVDERAGSVHLIIIRVANS